MLTKINKIIIRSGVLNIILFRDQDNDYIETVGARQRVLIRIPKGFPITTIQAKLEALDEETIFNAPKLYNVFNPGG